MIATQCFSSYHMKCWRGPTFHISNKFFPYATLTSILFFNVRLHVWLALFSDAKSKSCNTTFQLQHSSLTFSLWFLSILYELYKHLYNAYSVQFSSVTQPCPTLCNTRTAVCQVSESIINSQSLLKLLSTELVTPSNHLILWRPLLLLPSVFPSIRVISNESVLCNRWPKYWSFSISISHSNEYSGLISTRVDWLDLLAVQGTLKSLLQHHNSKASILWHSTFLRVKLSHPYVTTG